MKPSRARFVDSLVDTFDRRRSRPHLRLGALVAATALLSLWLASPTQAHDELVSSTPATGATVDKLPARVTLVFSESLGPDDLTIKVAGVKAAAPGLTVYAVEGKPSTLKVDLSGVRPAKTVLLAWQVIDPHDGHETSGVIALHVKETGHAVSPAAATGSAAPSATSADQPGSSLNPFLLVLGISIAIIVFCLLLMRRPRPTTEGRSHGN